MADLLNSLASELGREVIGYLQGEELPVALTNTRLLMIARSIHEDRTLCAQRKSAYLSSGALTTFVLNHSMVEVDMKLMNLTAKYGYLESDPPCPWDVDTCHGAAKGGHLHVLQWLRSQDPPCPWDEETCRYAALRGHLDVLQWLRSQDPPCPWDESTCSSLLGSSAKGGHLDVLQWLRSQDPPCPNLTHAKSLRKDAKCGYLDCVKILRTLDPPCPLDDPPCPLDEDTCHAAAEGGHLHVLQWARSQDPPCPWSENTCKNAAQGGHLHVLQWARSQDPPCPMDHIPAELVRKILEYLPGEELPFAVDSNLMCIAAKCGYLDCVKILRTLDPPCPLDDPPCPLDEDTCHAAAEGGHLHVLQWARSQDPPCPWGEDTCENEYLREFC
eukprot:GSChrysophyteH1.ASY1.ANO1.2304.1 assembled CDS